MMLNEKISIWLKDRKSRVLSFDDIRHYQRIVSALAETIILMANIDEVIEEHGKCGRANIRYGVHIASMYCDKIQQ
jgi:hypothetical protein